MFEETLGGRRITVSPTTLIARPAGELHANSYGSTPAHCLIIELHPDTVSRLKEATDVLQQSFITDTAFAAVAAHRIRAELRRRDDVAALVLESLIYELVAVAHRARKRRFREGRRTPWLDRTAELLREHTQMPGIKFGLAEVAAHVDIHPCHLARVFRREFGCSVGEYVRLRRLEEAARLLRTGTLALAAIAQVTGFADQSHFSNAFRRRFGLTPAQFRRLVADR
jgi:AraC-like DNA-binding protein